ncbi:MFS transporter [Celeribacter indicus]|uniref:Major facilitator superfamily (MFS) profile domain-containing protein n=1 Tax=Celeribacter indicus TaxID=1208324 RepID=A0A0B5DNN6_9RHOB|nr:MFS transporter [Celeribacter indicus]AJE45168.1 hypothetical protein P73_0453 [Celeribacter indicus]SDX25963.1 Predicted arabinose efflux permease, MFS family [Celeribacter indicus]
MTEHSARIRLTIFLVWLTGILAAGQFAKVAVSFPLFREIYPGHGAALGFLVSALSLMGVLFGLLAGMLLSRLGFRKLLSGALVLAGCLSLFQALLPPFWAMIASRALEGATHLVIVVAAPTLLGQIAPPEIRNTAMTLWSTVFAVAFALFSWVGLPFVARAGLPALLVLHGVSCLLMAVAFRRILPRMPRRELPPLRFAEIVTSHVTAYRSPWIAAPAAGWLFYAMSFVALVTVLPDYFPPESRAFLSGVMPVSALLVSMTLGIALLRVLPAITVVIIGFSAAACFALSLAIFGPQPALAVALIAASGLVQAGSFSSIPALNHAPRTQALSNGAVAQTGNIGNMVGTPLLLLLVAQWGFHGLVGFAFLAYLSGALVHLWLAALRRSAAVVQE